MTYAKSCTANRERFFGPAVLHARRRAAARRYAPCARAKSSVRVPKNWVRTPILGRFWHFLADGNGIF
eukprot:scaffold103568_cov57-Phaeocystis_antarctica.AAC.2